MAPNRMMRAEMLKQRMAQHQEPALAEVKVDVDAKDFDTALTELVQKAEAIVAIAPEDKADKLQKIAEMLATCQQEEEAGETNDEEAKEGPENDGAEPMAAGSDDHGGGENPY